MKVYKEFEPNDIDLNDDFNQKISAALLISNLAMPRSKTGEAPVDPTYAQQVLVSVFLNTIERFGYSVTKREEVPEIFKF